MRHHHSRLLSILAILVMSSCLTPIDFSTQYIGGRLVVEGQISSISGRTVVRVGILADKVQLPYVVTNATVQIIDEHGVSFTLEEKKPGTYVSTTSGVPGSTYFVRVTSNDGKIVESTRQRMPVIAFADEVSYSFEDHTEADLDGRTTTKSSIKITTSFKIPSPSTNLFSKWEVEEVYIIIPTDPPDPFGYTPPSCYITQNPEPQRIEIISHQAVGAVSIADFPVSLRVLDQSFHTRHYFNVYHASLTSASYEYWRKSEHTGKSNRVNF